MRIFGVSLVPVSLFAIRERIETAFERRENFRITTLNPEYLLIARTNKRFHQSIAQADLKVVDGFGICFVGWLHGKYFQRLTGADLLRELLSEAENRDVPVTFLLHPNGLSSEDDVRDAIKKQWPTLRSMVQGGEEFSLVVCNFGAPSQEFILDEYPLPGIKIGVGGGIDYLTGKQKRAPQFLRTTGLEWLWRLIQQPKRIKRIWGAVVVFPALAISDILGKIWQK